MTTRSRPGGAAKRKITNRPLLVINGDSFAHRSYHALPKTIRRNDGNGAGAIVGFANFLLRLYDAERPRAVIVGQRLSAPFRANFFLRVEIRDNECNARIRVDKVREI